MSTTYGAFTSGTNTIPVGYLYSASGGYIDDVMPEPVFAPGIVAGPEYQPGPPEAESPNRLVASAPADAGGGTSILTSILALFVPATQPVGTYTSVVSIDLVGT